MRYAIITFLFLILITFSTAEVWNSSTVYTYDVYDSSPNLTLWDWDDNGFGNITENSNSLIRDFNGLIGFANVPFSLDALLLNATEISYVQYIARTNYTASGSSGGFPRLSYNNTLFGVNMKSWYGSNLASLQSTDTFSATRHNNTAFSFSIVGIKTFDSSDKKLFRSLMEGTGGYNIEYHHQIFEINYTKAIITDVSYPEDNQTILLGSNSISATTYLYDGQILANATLYINGLLNQTTTLSGTTQQYSFPISLPVGLYNWSINTCTTSSNCYHTNNRSLEVAGYTGEELFYNEETLEASNEQYVLGLTLSPLVTVTSATLNYNSTSYSTNINQGSGYANISSTIQVPTVSTETNFTFNFNVTLSTGENFVVEGNQTVKNFILDDCSSNPYTVITTNLYDERTLSSIYGDIFIDLTLLNSDGSTIDSVEGEKYNVTTQSFCSNVNFTSSTYLYDLEIRYYSSNDNGSTYTHVPEFYHIQRSQAGNLPQTVNLYDLNINESQEFLISYRDNQYNAREDTVLLIQRKYPDGYRTVEAPLTSTDGKTTGHFDLNNYKYRIIATQYGVVLNTFDNPTLVCESELTSTCTLNLNGQSSPSNFNGWSSQEDFYYLLTYNGSTIVFDYIIPSGESKTISVSMIQYTPLTDPNTLLNTTTLSSAGSFEVVPSLTIGDSEVLVIIIVNGEVFTRASVYIQEDLNTYFALNNYVISGLFLIFLVTMFVSSPQLMVVASIFGIVLLGLLFLIKGSSIGLVLGAISFLILSGTIIVFKLNRKEET